MAWVARHLEFPERIFLYVPESVEGNIATLRVISKRENVSLNETYEFIIPMSGSTQKFIGVVKEIKGKVIVVKLEAKVSNGRKFNRFVVKRSTILVGIISESLERPIIGILQDISLGGFKLKLSEKDFNLLKDYFWGGSISTIAIFRFLETNESCLKADVTPVRFNEENNTVGFAFTFRSNNGNVLKIYEKVLKIENERG
ncbi:MAG: hypothetical protein DSZ30_02325 [Aquificaceae bacterium]|nr:MAG: hypothetical protein DSZ30_02325 [Aquificaceae bacterium]